VKTARQAQGTAGNKKARRMPGFIRIQRNDAGTFVVIVAAVF
jgi:hypothetical protein